MEGHVIITKKFNEGQDRRVGNMEDIQINELEELEEKGEVTVVSLECLGSISGCDSGSCQVQ